MNDTLKQALDYVANRQIAQYFDSLKKKCETAEDVENLIKTKLFHAAYDGARVALRLRDYGVARHDQIKRGEKNNG